MSVESLEFLLDLDAKMDGLVKGLDTLDKSVKALHDLDKSADKATHSVDHLAHATEHAGNASHGAAGAHGKHGHAVWELGHQYEGAKHAVSEFAEGLGLVLAYEVVEKLVDKVKELGEEIIHAGTMAERTEKSFKLLLGDEGGEHILEYLEAIHHHTEFSLEKLQALAAGFVRVGIAGQGLRYAVAAAADLAAMPGGNLEEAASALERIKRTGHVDNRTLGGVGFGEQDFLAQLAKRTGKSAVVLKKEMEQGKLDADQSLASLYDLIRKRTGKPLGAAAEGMSTLMGASLTHLKEVPEELYKQIAKSPAFERLNQFIRDLTERLDPKTPLGMRFFESMDKSLSKFVDALQKVDMGRLIEDVGKLIEKGPALVDLILKLAQAIVIVGKATAWVYEHTVPGQLLKGHFDAQDKAARLVDPEKAREATRKLLDDGSPGPAASIRGQLWGKAMGDGVIKGVEERTPDVKGATTEMGEAAHGGMKKEIKAESPSKVFRDLGRMSGEGYLEGLDGSLAAMPDIQPAGSFAKPAPMGGAGGPIQVTVNVTTNVGGSAGGEAGEQIGQQVATAVEAILPSALESAFQRMQQEAGS